MDNSIPVRILRKNVVRDLTGWSNSTIWRKVKDGIFPSPVRLAPNSIGWYEREFDIKCFKYQTLIPENAVNTSL